MFRLVYIASIIVIILMVSCNERVTNGKDSAPMVLIPAGEFQMGSNDEKADEKPIHIVFLDAFYMDKYEVTNAQYKRFVDINTQWRKDRIGSQYHYGNYLAHWEGNNYPAGKANHPVVYVSWDAASAYAEWAGKRLPTEAEWEKGARGGLTGMRYPWGNWINHDNANYKGTGGRDVWRGTSPVGSFQPNGHGLYDMAGNVWEWCADLYGEKYYSTSPRNNPTGPGGGIRRCLRGGAWDNREPILRCAYRHVEVPANAFDNIGFRCVQNVAP